MRSLFVLRRPTSRTVRPCWEGVWPSLDPWDVCGQKDGDSPIDSIVTGVSEGEKSYRHREGAQELRRRGQPQWSGCGLPPSRYQVDPGDETAVEKAPTN